MVIIKLFLTTNLIIVYLMCFLIWPAKESLFLQLLLSLHCVVWSSTTPKDFNKTRCLIPLVILRIWSDVSLFYLFITLASLWLSVADLIHFLILFFWYVKGLSTLTSGLVGLLCTTCLFLFFLLAIISHLIWFLRLSNCTSLFIHCFCIHFLLRKENSFFNRLWSFDIFELIWSLTGNVNWWSGRNRFLVWRTRWVLPWLFSSLRASSLEITVSNCSCIAGCHSGYGVFFIQSFFDSSGLTRVFSIKL